MGSDYESTVRRVEKAVGRVLNDYEVIVYLADEMEQLREKVKLYEAAAPSEDKFAKFREATFKGIREMYEYFSEEEQHLFDLGELYGRLKTTEEVMNDEDKK